MNTSIDNLYKLEPNQIQIDLVRLSKVSQLDMKDVHMIFMGIQRDSLNKIYGKIQERKTKLLEQIKNREGSKINGILELIPSINKKNSKQRHKILKIAEALDSEALNNKEKVEKILKHSKKARFDELRFLSRKYLILLEIQENLQKSKDEISYSKLSEQFNSYYNLLKDRH